MSQPLPKSIQLSEMLIREIASGRIPHDSKLPPERQMAQNLGVAVGTLRSALNILEKKGLLRRVQGSGNYVNAHDDVQSIYSFFRLELIEGGGLPTADVLEVRRLDKEKDMPNIGTGRRAHRIRRLRYLNDTPIALEEIWLDGRYVDWITADELQDSLYFYYKTKLKLVIASAVDTVSTWFFPRWTPENFNAKPQDISGFVERLSYDQNGQAAEYSKTWYDPKACRYINYLGKRYSS